MAKYLLAGESINWLAVFALLTFMFIFIMAALLAYGKKKSRYAEMAALPLDDGSIQAHKDQHESDKRIVENTPPAEV